MKSLFLFLSLFALPFSAFSAEIDRFYQPEYEIVSVSSMCPPPAPGGTTCAAMGKIVKVKTILAGCLDEVEFFRAQQETTESGDVNIHIASLAKFPEANNRVRCVRMPEDSQTVFLMDGAFGEINLINQKLEL